MRVKKIDIELAEKIKNEFDGYLKIHCNEFFNVRALVNFLILKIAMLENEILNIKNQI